MTSLIGLWLVYAFLINKAPHYGRLLLTLPFVAYFSVEAIRAIAETVSRVSFLRLRRRFVTAAVSAILIAVIAGWNIGIAADFAEVGREDGDDIGSTGRYVQSQREMPGIRFYMAASERWPYYEWGWPSIWVDRMRIFAQEGQVQPIVRPDGLPRFRARQPFVLFLSAELWARSRASLKDRFPQGTVHNVTSGGHVAFFVPRRA